jgi:hypothetical protein
VIFCQRLGCECWLVAQRQHGSEPTGEASDTRPMALRASYHPRGVIFELPFGAINYRIAIFARLRGLEVDR